MGRRSRVPGFTLIELMLVSSIVGLLVATAVPRFANLIDKSKEAVFKGNLGTLRSALNLYYADNDGYYPASHRILPGRQGLIHLHPKYIDFSTIRFRQPKYAGGGSLTARQLYDPSDNAIYPPNFNDEDTSLPITCSHYWMNYPSYFVWSSVAGGRGTYACLGMTWSLTDLSGKRWSTW